MSKKPRILVVGGVAAGASFAARTRRLSEEAEIIVLERGPDVSFANCGLPYFIGGEITNRDALAVQTPQTLKGMLNLDVRTRTEATAIDRTQKRIQVCNHKDGSSDWMSYDKLMLAPGAKPIRPPLEGLEDSRVHTLRNLQDMDQIKEAANKASKAAVIGAGFIGLEMAEQLKKRGLDVTLVELQNQVLPPLDMDMTLLLESELRTNEVEVILGDGIACIEGKEENLIIHLASGKTCETELAILSIGVQPETELAKEAGLEVGPRGHLVVNGFQQTSDPDIYAAGDAVETADRINGSQVTVPLGGPANRQGRVAADHIFLGEKARPYPGSLGTAILRVFDVSAGLTGWSEHRLQQAGIPYSSTIVNDNHHAAYYPGAKPMTLKVMWQPENGQLLGAQATGFEGVDKRLDVLTTAIAGGMTIEDLCHLELSYAPPFGNAKDIVNLAGFTGTNQIDELVDPIYELPDPDEVQVVDVRPKPLAEAHPVAHTFNIPFPTLRSNLDKLDKDRPVVTLCAFGKMSYFASRILAMNGFNVQSYNGGIKAHIDPRTPAKSPAP